MPTASATPTSAPSSCSPTRTFHYADNLTIDPRTPHDQDRRQFMRQRLDVFYAGNNGRTGFHQFQRPVHAGSERQVADVQSRQRSRFRAWPAERHRPRPEQRQPGASARRSGASTVQDDWRVTNSLTLNLGVRWDYHTPLGGSERPPGQLRPVHRRSWNLPDRTATAAGCTTPYKKDFQPRLGFAWTPRTSSKKLVLRGAYTISSFMEGTGTNLRLTIESADRLGVRGGLPTALSNLPGSTLDQGFVGSRGSVRRRQHSPVGSQRPPRRSAAVEPHGRVSTSRPATC